MGGTLSKRGDALCEADQIETSHIHADQTMRYSSGIKSCGCQRAFQHGILLSVKKRIMEMEMSCFIGSSVCLFLRK